MSITGTTKEQLNYMEKLALEASKAAGGGEMRNYDISVVVERCFIPPVDGSKMDYWFESFAINENTTIGEIISHLRKLDYVREEEHPLRKLGTVTLVATEALIKRQEEEK